MLKQPVSIVNYTNVAIVKLKVGKESFELACFKNKIQQYREKIESDINEVLQVREIFTNAIKGDKANKKLLEKTFPNLNKDKIIDLILNKGDLQVSDKERENNLNNLKKDIASIIVEKTYDTKSGKPFTQKSILDAMKEIGVNINNKEDSKKQALKYIKEIQEKNILNIQRKLMKLSFLKKNENVDTSLLIKYLEDIKSNIQNKKYFLETGNSNNIKNKLVCLVLPNYFREINDRFSQNYTIETLSMNETIVPSYDDIDISKLNLNTNTINNEPEIKFSNSVVNKFLDENYETNQSNINTYKCTKCKEAFFNKNEELRKHYKTAWHEFNVKLFSESKETMNLEEYTDFTFLNKK